MGSRRWKRVSRGLLRKCWRGWYSIGSPTRRCSGRGRLRPWVYRGLGEPAPQLNVMYVGRTGQRMDKEARRRAAEAFPDLAEIAPELSQKRGWIVPGPPTYDLVSGAIWWLDEVDWTRPKMAALRPVLRYRTMLLRGVPEEAWRAHWEAARLLFPAWVGFSAKRLRWTRWCESAWRTLELETARLTEGTRRDDPER